MAACVATLIGTVLMTVGGAETTTWPVGVVVTETVMTTSAPPDTDKPPAGAPVGVEPERPPEEEAEVEEPPVPVPPAEEAVPPCVPVPPVVPLALVCAWPPEVPA